MNTKDKNVAGTQGKVRKSYKTSFQFKMDLKVRSLTKQIFNRKNQVFGAHSSRNSGRATKSGGIVC